MPRSPRVVAPGGVYHVAPRGNGGRAIFKTEDDRARHLILLTRVTKKYGWLVFILLPHDEPLSTCLLQITEGGLSEGMQELLGRIRTLLER
jgi:hypothetical protein